MNTKAILGVLRLFILSIPLLSITGTALSPGLSNAAAQGSCNFGPALPIFNSIDRTVIGIGERGLGCSDSVRMQVLLKRDVNNWFDKTLASTDRSLRNGQLTVLYRCRGTGHQTVYVEVRVGGKKLQSRRLTVAYCG